MKKGNGDKSGGSERNVGEALRQDIEHRGWIEQLANLILVQEQQGHGHTPDI